MIKQPAHRQAGFTLLEVLVALAVLGISLGVLLPIFSGSVRRQDTLAEERVAIALARSKLAAVGSEIPLVDGVSEGKFENGFGWRLEIQPYSSNPNSLIDVKQATLSVRWPKPNGKHALTVTALRLLGRQ